MKRYIMYFVGVIMAPFYFVKWIFSKFKVDTFLMYALCVLTVLGIYLAFVTCWLFTVHFLDDVLGF